MAVRDEEKLDLVWGAAEIAKVIDRTARATFNMLENGDLPARKVGGRWVAEKSRLVAFFMEDAS